MPTITRSLRNGTTTRKGVVGPSWHGRRISDAEAARRRYLPGYLYEIIDGRLYVSPQANPPENRLEEWLRDKLKEYSRERTDIINFVSAKARVYLPRRRVTTCPEPDVAAYHDFPLSQPFQDLTWEELAPILVAEVLSESDPFKDLIRNVSLYLQVPSIEEYWILDGQGDPNKPRLLLYRRRGKQWQKPREIAYRETYTTPLLPGFKLVVDPVASRISCGPLCKLNSCPNC